MFLALIMLSLPVEALPVHNLLVAAKQASALATEPPRADEAASVDLQIFGIKLTDVLLLVLTAAALILTWSITAYQWRLARKQNAVQLHADYYGVEHYVNVVSAVVQVRLKWLYTPDDKERHAYRQLVAAGWAPAVLKTGEAPTAVRFRLYVRRNARENIDAADAHYHASAGAAGLSEHQAVAALLHFWSRLAGLLDARAIDRRMAKEFFAPAYEYNREFFASLREMIEPSIVRGDPRPAWLEHTRTLERFFG
jgi:hypothetical protein